MSHDARTTPAGPEVNSGLVLGLCSGATFMAFLDLSVVNIAFPNISEDFTDASIATLTWVISGYAVMFAALLTPVGRLADTLGRTRMFLGSLTGFVLTSLLCAVAPSAEWLVVGRFLQGATAAGMIPAALGLVLASTPPQKVTKAIGAWSAAGGFAAVVGPVVGGLLVEQFDWRSVFIINVPIGLLLLVFSVRGLPRHLPATGTAQPDLIGTVAFGLGIGLLVAALTEGDAWGWTDVRTLGFGALGLVLIAVALLRSRGHAAPAVDISLWSNRRYALSNLVVAIFGVSLFSYLLAGALFATGIWQYGILRASGALTVGAITAMIGSVVAGASTKPGAQRWFAVVGLALFAACTAIMSTDLFDEHPRFLAAWLPAGTIGGLGIGFAVTALSTIGATSLPPQRFAAGSGMSLTARQFGGALGIAGLAAIFGAHGAVDVDGFHILYRAITAVSAVAAIAALTLVDRSALAPAAATPGAATPAITPAAAAPAEATGA